MPHITSKFHHLSAYFVRTAQLAQSVEHQTFNLRVMGSSPILGESVFFSFVSHSLFLRCIPCKTKTFYELFRYYQFNFEKKSQTIVVAI